MISIESFRKLALSLADTTESPHFEKASFRTNKKIFATLSEKEKLACLKLNELEQSVFCAFDKEIIYPVPNKWGQQGWTLFRLDKIKKEMMTDALTVAHELATHKNKSSKSRTSE